MPSPVCLLLTARTQPNLCTAPAATEDCYSGFILFAYRPMNAYLLCTTKGPALCVVSRSGSHADVYFEGNSWAVPVHGKDREKGTFAQESLADSAKVEKVLQHVCALCASLLGEKAPGTRLVLGGKKPRKLAACEMSLECKRRDAGKKNRMIVEKAFSAVGDILISRLAGLLSSIDRAFGMRSAPREESKPAMPEAPFTDKRFIHEAALLCADRSLFAVTKAFQLGQEHAVHVSGLATEEHKHGAILPVPEPKEKGPPGHASRLSPLFESFFWRSECEFVNKLSQGRKCIEEMGRHIYNSDFNDAFKGLLEILEMFLAWEDGLGRKAREDPGDAELTFRAYAEHIAQIAGSDKFQRYVKSIEERILVYKRISRKETEELERKHGINVAFLYVEVFHRLIKYRMYFEDAMRTATKDVEGGGEGEPGRGDARSHIDASCECMCCFLHKASGRIAGILSRTNSFKKAQRIKEEGHIVPDIDDEPLEKIEMEEGCVLIMERHLLVVKEGVTWLCLGRGEFVWFTSKELEDPFEDERPLYLDLCTSSAFASPIGDDDGVVVDFVSGMKVEWVRMQFKSESARDLFARTLSHTAAPQPRPECRYLGKVLLADRGVDLHKKARNLDSLGERDVRASHMRSRLIRLARAMEDKRDFFYLYGRGRRLEPQRVAWVLRSLNRVMDLLNEAEKGLSFSRACAEALSGMCAPELGKEGTGGKRIVKRDEFHQIDLLPEQISVADVRSVFAVYAEYLSYVLRRARGEESVWLSEQIAELFKRAFLDGRRKAGLDTENREFLEDIFRALGVDTATELGSFVPSSLSVDEFLAAVLILRMFISLLLRGADREAVASACCPFFLFNLGDLSDILRALPA